MSSSKVVKAPVQLFVVGAPSGAGKTTLASLLVARCPGLRFSVSHTTRPARPGEVEGRDYHFVSKETFETERENGGFLESAEVYGNLYGTHRSELEAAVGQGLDLLIDVDLQGARSIRRTHPEAILILILPPSLAELERRLRSRGTEPREVVERRLALARQQLGDRDLYDYAVVNSEVEEACRALEAIVIAARHRTNALEATLDALFWEGGGR